MDELLFIVTHAFAFLGTPISQKLIRPEMFRGGFVLTYKNDLKIQYLDWEFQVTSERGELFGESNKDGFSGIMFSPQHLSDHVHQIAEHVRPQMSA